jgi:hypothetical protein
MTKNQVHEWHERAEQGGRNYYRGYWDSRAWRMSRLGPDDEDWVNLDAPEAAMWHALRDVLFRKYQRKRLAIRLLDSVDAILTDMGETPGKPDKPIDNDDDS